VKWALSVVLGAIIGVTSGYVTESVRLALKHWRNQQRIERGRAPFRDCVPSSIEVGWAIYGAAVGPAAWRTFASWSWVVIAAMLIPALFLLISSAFIVQQARE
jgi:hypothetical protein